MSEIKLGIIGGGQLGSLLCLGSKKLNINTLHLKNNQEMNGKFE